MLHKYVTRTLLSAAHKPQTFPDGLIKRGFQATKAGPPKYPIGNIDFLVLGGGFVFGICLLPLWALKQVQKWSEIHNSTE